MNNPAETAFSTNLTAEFASHHETVRGHIRYEMVKRDLGGLVMGQELEIVDVGGGTGIETVWLAGLGHNVTLVEPTREVLSEALHRIKYQPPEVSDKIEVCQGTTATLLSRLGKAGCYDMVLSHGVGMYLPDPQTHFTDVMELVKPGGHLSLLEKGLRGAQIKLDRLGRFAESTALPATRRTVNSLGRDVWTFSPKELQQTLEAGGMTNIEWSGVRILHDNDTRPINSVDPPELVKIVEGEYAAGHDADTRGTGQMLHFIAQKPAT